MNKKPAIGPRLLSIHVSLGECEAIHQETGWTCGRVKGHKDKEHRAYAWVEGRRTVIKRWGA